MQALTIERYTAMLVSPDDGGAVSLHRSGDNWAFLAPGTGLLHPVIDDIAVLLSADDRSFELESAPVQAFLDAGPPPELEDAARRTLTLLESRRGQTSFAWEDEAYWSEAYRRDASSPPDDSGWNDRVWQRTPLVDAAGVNGTVTIVDIGCGEGQNFRCLLKSRLAPESIYVAVDISLAGLNLARSRNAWTNSLYVLCSADDLPIAPQTADLICYFGLLHHTRNKEKNLSTHLRLLRPGGHIILAEAIERPRILPDRFRTDQSAHEERFDVKDLEARIATPPGALEIVYWKTRLTVFWSGMARVFGTRPMRYRPSNMALSFIDQACIKILGPVIPWFRGAEVLAVLKRSE